MPRPSALGGYSYEVIDTKLGRHAKASYVLQLAFYGDLLAKVQQLDPHAMHMVLGTREQVTFTCSEYSRYFRRLLGRFTQTIANASAEITTRPTPCAKCSQCHWNDRCTQQRAVEDSLHQVAGIRSSQVPKLEASGVETLAQLSRTTPAKNACLTKASLAPKKLPCPRTDRKLKTLGADDFDHRRQRPIARTMSGILV